MARQVKADFRKAGLNGKDLKMLEFVEKLTLTPWLIDAGDVEHLKRVGFNDQEILHIVLGCAHFNYLNRIADGVGIQFEYPTELPDFRKPASDDSTQETGLRPATTGTGAPPPRGPWIDYPRTSMSSVPENVPRLFYLVLGSNTEAQTMIVAWRKYQLLSSSTLDTHFRARIALYVSGINNCAYSRDWFSRFLHHGGEPDSATAALASGRRPSTLSPLESHLFDFASLLTFEAWKTTEGTIDEIRKNGLDDRSLLQFMMLVSYINFENRVAFGLGLASEPLES